MKSIDTLTSTTRLFPTALGLRLVPAGLWFLALAIPGLGPLPSPLHLLLGLLAAAAIWPIHRWYRARFGYVQPERLRLDRGWALLAGLGAAALVLVLGRGVAELGVVVLLVALLLLATALAYLLPRPFPGSRPAVLLLVLAAALGAVPLFLLAGEPARLGAAGKLFSLALGAVLCLAGALEHRLLVRALGEGEPEP